MWQGSGEPSLSAAVEEWARCRWGREAPSLNADVGGGEPGLGCVLCNALPCEFCCASNAALAAGNPRRLVYRRGRLGRESGVTGVVDRYHVDCSKQTANRTDKQRNKRRRAYSPQRQRSNGRPAALPDGVGEAPPQPVASCGTRCRQPFDDSPPSVPLRRMARPSARQLA